MDLWQFVSLVDRRPKWLNVDAVLAQSCMTNMVSPMDFTVSESYAFTHNILFLKNFGVSDPRFDSCGPPIQRDKVALMIARHFKEDNSDIILELVMVLGMLGKLNGKDCTMMTKWLLDRNGDKDYISGPKFDPDKNLKYSGLDRDWVANYHTTLVAMSYFLLAGKGNWMSAIDSSPILPDNTDELLDWGAVLEFTNRYELPAAVVAAEKAVRDSDFSWMATAEFCAYFEHIKDSENKIFGYWTDEMMAVN
jgi:hypothetical protein